MLTCQQLDYVRSELVTELLADPRRQYIKQSREEWEREVWDIPDAVINALHEDAQRQSFSLATYTSLWEKMLMLAQARDVLTVKVIGGPLPYRHAALTQALREAHEDDTAQPVDS